MNRTFIVAIALVLGVVVGVAGFKLYNDQHQPDGVQINVGPNGLSVKGK